MKRNPKGFTLVEILVVITIIGILVSLLMPGVQAAREAARRAQCSNNLKQVGLAAIQHETKWGHFPTGGWGWDWVGDPDRGFTKRQPGGWVYNILPYLEQENLHDFNKDDQPDVHTQKQLDGANLVTRTPLAMFNCPSRRQTMTFPKPRGGTFVAYNASENKADNTQARTDYAINTGSQARNEYQAGPSSLSAAETYNWGDLTQYNGLSFIRSEVGMAHVTDGASVTILIGEKYLNPDHYLTGQDPTDNENMYSGFNNDNFRTTTYPPIQDRRGYYPDMYHFGSAHSSGCHFVFCDGSVKKISFSVDRDVFKSGGNRKDGGGIKPDDL